MSPNISQKYQLATHPLTHSILSFVHERLFQLSKKNTLYDLYTISQQDFKERVCKLLHSSGLAISSPYQHKIIKSVDSVDEKPALYHPLQSADCGDTNVGYNTECYGFLKGLQALGADLKDSSVLVLGVGEYAKMVSAETVLAGSKLTIAARPEYIEKAEELQSMLLMIDPNAYVRVINMNKIEDTYTLIVNTSPIGMHPHITDCPVSEDTVAHASFVYDLICNPPKTKLLGLAEKHGIPYSNGVPMLVWQTIGAHFIWYNARFDDEAIDSLISETQQKLMSGFSRSPSSRACQI